MTRYIVVAPRGVFVDECHELPTADMQGFALKPDAQPIELINTEIDDAPQVYAVNAAQCDIPSGFTEVSLRKLLDVWSKDALLLGFRASQLVRWQRDHGFCSRCGGVTRFAEHEPCAICTVCDYKQYPRLQPCVIVAIIKNADASAENTNSAGQILLAQSAKPNKPFNSLIAGFVEVGESLEDAVHREAFEETRLRLKNIRYLGSQPWPFPSNLMVGFVADYAGGDIELADQELSEARFYDFDALPTIPPKGTIARSMIDHVCFAAPLDL